MRTKPLDEEVRQGETLPSLNIGLSCRDQPLLKELQEATWRRHYLRE